MSKKIKKIEVYNFLGHEKIEYEFNESINIFIGPNGCGKTTLLKMLSELKNLNLEYFLDISFSKIKLILSDNAIIIVKKSEKNIFLFQKLSKKLILSNYWERTDTEEYLRGNIRDKYYTSEKKIIDYYKKQGVFKNNSTIEKLDLNIDFIPLLRTYCFVNEEKYEYLNLEKLLSRIKDEHIIAMKQYSLENEVFKKKILGVPFSQINISFEKMVKDILEFTNESADNLIEIYKELVEESELDKVKAELEKLKQAKSKLITFNKKRENLSSKQKININLDIEKYKIVSNVLNLDLIKHTGELATQLLKSKKDIFKKFREIEDVINSFFKITNKELKIDEAGDVKIYYRGNNLDVFKLSSGEKQLITLFSHIILKSYEKENQIFLIDEPEISLHLAWQQKFIDALSKIKNNQYVLATHSPEIIGKYYNCIKQMGDLRGRESCE